MTHDLKLENSNLTATIDKDDLELVLKTSSKWYLSKRGYVQCNQKYDSLLPYITIMLHRLVIKCPSKLVVDHLNRNKLDNRKCNLEIVSGGTNISRQLKRKSKYGIKYKNVMKSKNKFIARVKINNRYIYGGTFETEEAAGARVAEINRDFRT